MAAEILTIGTELLLGESLDTNTRAIALRLRDIGLDLYRTQTVGDNAGRIAVALREAMARARVVITTGGLGPTVDDPTREAAAAALGVGLTFHPELWEQIQERFARFGRTPTENNRRQASLPEGARPIPNPVGTAPGFLAESGDSVLIALPGVPVEMTWMLDNEVIPLLQKRLGGLPLHTRILHAAGVGESWVDDRIQDLEAMSDPTVGILAHPGLVDVRIATKAPTAESAREKIAPIESALRERLGPALFGADQETLAGAAITSVKTRDWRLLSLEAGTDGALAGLLSGSGPGWAGSIVVPEVAAAEAALAAWIPRMEATAGLLLTLRRRAERATIEVHLMLPDGAQHWSHSYGGPPPTASAWAAAIALDRLRRHLA